MHSVLVVLLFTAGLCQGMPSAAPIQQVKDYLYQYGYLPATDLENGVQRSERDLEQGIKRLQKFIGLEMTGKVDGPTMDMIGKPRCGMPDMVVKDDEVFGVVEDDAPANYSLAGSKWVNMPVTYQFENYTPDLPEGTVRAETAQAFALWTSASGLSMKEETCGGSADIMIRFGGGSHGCNYPFDGSNGVLAHAFYPRNGDMHFDDDEPFTSGTTSGINFLWVAIHELGHSLGIGHSQARGAIMYPYYTGYVANPQLHSDDVAAIQALYGN